MKKNTFKVQTISVYISTTLVLLLLGIMGIMYTGTKSLSRNMQQNLTMSVVIKNGIKEADIQKLKENIDNDSRVHSSVYISKEQALAEESEALQANPEEILGYNPYEASIEITLHHEYSTNEHLADISETISERKEVKEVIYQKELAQAVNDNISRIGMAMFTLLIMLTLISWSLIGNLVRLSIYSKRFILHTMKLVGATWGFIRKPFIIKNMYIGLVSGIIANILLATGVYLIAQEEPYIMTLLPATDLIVTAAAVILFGMTICTLCAYIAVNSFLRMRKNDLYFI
ncbi:MAG: permease-like cell division protein FtsX [Bacteroidaceae bacterium]|nr:permease-like cell division protein FtsX [Bacteroidaceae bacterium]